MTELIALTEIRFSSGLGSATAFTLTSRLRGDRRDRSLLLLTGRSYSGLPSRAGIWSHRIRLCAVPWINRIVERPIVLVRCAWRKAFILTRATIHPAIVLTRILTAILATILPGAKSVLRASVLLGDRGS